MKRRRYPIIGVAVFLGLTILATATTLGFRSALIERAAYAVESLRPQGDLQRRIELLERENADLKARLSRDAIFPPQGRAIVYSSYPFNSRSEILISLGRVDGVQEGDIATWGSNILVGKVSRVGEKQSSVRTIFDAGFETAVRIGTGTVDGLMRGGNKIEVDLIPEDAPIEVGDIVFTAASDFPYGLQIGQIKEINTVEGSVFKSALLEPTVELRSLRDVSIVN